MLQKFVTGFMMSDSCPLMCYQLSYLLLAFLDKTDKICKNLYISEQWMASSLSSIKKDIVSKKHGHASMIKSDVSRHASWCMQKKSEIL